MASARVSANASSSEIHICIVFCWWICLIAACAFKSASEVEGRGLPVYVTNVSFEKWSFRWEDRWRCLSLVLQLLICLFLLIKTVCLYQFVLAASSTLNEIFWKGVGMFQFIQTEFSALLNSWNTHMHHLWPPLILLSSHSVEGNDWVSAILKRAYFRFPGPPSFPPCSIHSNMLLSTICHDGASFIQSDKVNCSLEEDASLICCVQAFQTPFLYLGFRFAAVAAHVFHVRRFSSRLESKTNSEV